jgi:hypothetical protein
MIPGDPIAPRGTSTTLEVRVSLVSAEGLPIVSQAMRLILAEDPGFERADAGSARHSDERGELHWSTAATLQTRYRKLPGNFLSQLVAAPRATRHLALAVQLPYLGREWRYVVSVDRFEDGTQAQLDGLRIYGADAMGAFVERVRRDRECWQFAGLPGVVTSPGYEVLRLTLVPAGNAWSLDLGLRRLPEPRRR